MNLSDIKFKHKNTEEGATCPFCGHHYHVDEYRSVVSCSACDGRYMGAVEADKIAESLVEQYRQLCLNNSFDEAAKLFAELDDKYITNSYWGFELRSIKRRLVDRQGNTLAVSQARFLLPRLSK